MAWVQLPAEYTDHSPTHFQGIEAASAHDFGLVPLLGVLVCWGWNLLSQLRQGIPLLWKHSSGKECWSTSTESKRKRKCIPYWLSITAMAWDKIHQASQLPQWTPSSREIKTWEGLLRFQQPKKWKRQKQQSLSGIHSPTQSDPIKVSKFKFQVF